jgi:hypothetical protein
VGVVGHGRGAGRRLQRWEVGGSGGRVVGVGSCGHRRHGWWW